MNRVQAAKPWAERIFLAVGLILCLAGVAAGASEGGQGGVSPAMVTDLIWRTVNFLIFAAILIKLVTRPAKEFFAKRSQEIGQSLEDLEDQKAAAARALKEAEAQLARVAAEREKIIQQYRAEGEVEKAKILEKAEMVAARIKEMAALTIEQESKKAAKELKQEAVAQASQLAEDLLKKKITPADHERLVEDYLHKVVEKH